MVMSVRSIRINSSEYPENLRTIIDPPEELFVRGTLREKDAVAVAIVGSRNASLYGLRASEDLAYDLASMGITIVSGMARGIDTAAHRGAIKARGRTIAVLGSGHGDIYPSENKKLYDMIAENGAVVTEFDHDAPPHQRNFPRRNRIISGLSIGVVVVEATRVSGSLITARLALEQGRDVFAVPGKINSPTSAGTNDLIRDGACLVQTAEDVIEELGLKALRAQPADEPLIVERPALTEKESAVLRALSDEPVYIDEISERSDVSARELESILLLLEIKKVISVLPGRFYVTAGARV